LTRRSRERLAAGAGWGVARWFGAGTQCVCGGFRAGNGWGCGEVGEFATYEGA